MAAEYTWCQVEPATTILCACVVTYRPLFTKLPLNLSKASSLFSESGTGSEGSRRDGWKDLEAEPNEQLQWAVGKDIHGRDDHRLWQLNAKATKDGPQIVNVDLLPSDNNGPYTYSRSPRSLDILDARAKGAKAPYHAPLFEVTEDRAVKVHIFSQEAARKELKEKIDW